MQMKQCQRWLMRFMIMGVIAVAVGMASSAQAQTTANGPYYATPSWDQKLTGATRFIVLADWNSDAVLDRETGLVWEKRPSTIPATWGDARSECFQKSVGYRAGWRLPSIAELTSLVDPLQPYPGPTLPQFSPFVLPPFAVLWSATTDAESPTSAWVVNLISGIVGSGNKALLHLGWCVRGGNNADQF